MKPRRICPAVVMGVTFILLLLVSHGPFGIVMDVRAGRVSSVIDSIESAESSTVRQREEKEKKSDERGFSITPHRQIYVLPFTYDPNPNVDTYEFSDQSAPKQIEIKFQLSFKMMVWKGIFNGHGDLFCAYTQLSFWQAYDLTSSSPFRETNYEPEAFLKFDTNTGVLGLTNRVILVGINHESNGQVEPFSRSWNRIFITFVLDRGNFVMAIKPWYRIPESDAEDDNPDIHEYLGYGDLTCAYRRGGHVFSLLLRNNLQGTNNRGALELGWSYPLTRNVKAYVQYFNGYGESLVDYKDPANRIGIGFMLFDWL